MTQSDNHPYSKTWHGRQLRQELAPNSLLCPAAKTLKKLLLPKILTHIHFQPALHGFGPKKLDMHCIVDDRPQHCCRRLKKKAGSPSNNRHAHLTAAFGNVDHQQLLHCVYNANMPATIRRWLNNYMHNR